MCHRGPMTLLAFADEDWKQTPDHGTAASKYRANIVFGYGNGSISPRVPEEESGTCDQADPDQVQRQTPEIAGLHFLPQQQPGEEGSEEGGAVDQRGGVSNRHMSERSPE
mmetsp:Transcript_35714/g.66136  ORF Transcript_35714/g.66136 Transcript_35714/m.66136 type:complete len:110 (+) Transcript_35714:737-1066(+)